ncbi:MAG: trypsin-like peptidase domain-containing protein [Rhodospirillales bacterium]|nr:trypsin-like peptidase domain-containing protein [Rhodospirillales bacterium]
MRLRVILFLMKIVGRLTLVLCVTLALWAGNAHALDKEILNSVVRIKPDWSLAARGRDATGKPRDPQGSGIAVMSGGYIATNVHVIGDATDIDVMTEDGRVLKAAIIGRDKMTDIALIKVDADLPILETAPTPGLAEAVCAIGNQFGLGLSVTCGVVSAVGRSGMGFNPVEDFIQTDAAVNPGGSGGALVDMSGRLVGMVAAIFTKSSDADIGVNFATSVPLLMRVVNDLKAHGHVVRGVAGFKAGPLPPSMAHAGGGAMVESVVVDGPAFVAGLEAGDVITHIDGAAVSSMPVLEAMMFKKRPGETMTLDTIRGEERRRLTIKLGGA